MQALFSDYSDELARTATITVQTGAVETDYGVDLLTDDNPAKVLRATGTSLALQLDFGTATPIGQLALIHSTLETGDDVRIQGNATASWGSPSFNVAVPIAGWRGSGVTRWPTNTWFDVDAEATYNPSGYRYYRLTFGVTTPLSQALQLGQLRIHPSLRTFYIDRDTAIRPRKPIIKNTTAFDVDTIYPRGTTRFAQTFTLGGFEAAERASFEAHWYDVDGQSYPWLFVPDATVNECYLVRWATTEYDMARALQSVARVSGAVQEVSRGLRPGN